MANVTLGVRLTEVTEVSKFHPQMSFLQQDEKEITKVRKNVKAPFFWFSALCLCLRKDEIELITWIDLLSSEPNYYTELFCGNLSQHLSDCKTIYCTVTSGT